MLTKGLIKFSIRLKPRFTYICEICLHLRNPEELAVFARCGIRDKNIVPTNFTLQVFVRKIHGNFKNEILSTLDKNIKTPNFPLNLCTVWPRYDSKQPKHYFCSICSHFCLRRLKYSQIRVLYIFLVESRKTIWSSYQKILKYLLSVAKMLIQTF